MAFLYDLLPPVLPDYIPAFIGTEFTIPIIMQNITNEETSLEDFGIQTVQVFIINQNDDVNTIFTNIYKGKEIQINPDNNNQYLLKLNITTLQKQEINTFYKIQVRFSTKNKNEIKDENDFTEWSSICLIKKIQQPKLNIKLGKFLLANHSKTTLPALALNIIGSLSSQNEILSKYQITVKLEQKYEYTYKLNENSDGKIEQKIDYKTILTTDWLAPTSKNFFNHIFSKRIFEPNKTYKLYINYKTESGYTTKNNYCYTIEIEKEILDNISFYFQTVPDSESGSIKLRIFGEQNLHQNFIIQRSSSSDNFEDWKNIAIIQFQGDKLDGTIQTVIIKNIQQLDLNTIDDNMQDNIQLSMYQWSDFTVKSGVFYKYAIAPLYKNVDSITYLNTNHENQNFLIGKFRQNQQSYTCVFDDIFLTGENGKNLKIKYNPTISNFKYNIQDSIQTTLGSKYPFITRNGTQKYRSFQIGGLITLFMDINDRWPVPSYFLDSKTKKSSLLNQLNNIIQVTNEQYIKLKTLFNNTLNSDNGNGPYEISNRFSQEQLKNITIQQLLSNRDFNNELQKIISAEMYQDIYNSIGNAETEEENLNILKNIYKIIANKNNQVYIGDFILPQDLFSDIEIASRQVYNQYNNINKFNDIIYEREFREAVYSFLYNDTPKLFRSTPQGNILVRLTNLSFSPLKELGRQLYSFTADAIEIDECSIQNFNKYNIYSYGEWKLLSSMLQTNNITQYVTMTEENINSKNLLNNKKIINIKDLKIIHNSLGYQPPININTKNYEKNSKYHGWLIQYTLLNQQKIQQIFFNIYDIFQLPKATEIDSFIIKCPSLQIIKDKSFKFKIEGTVICINKALQKSYTITSTMLNIINQNDINKKEYLSKKIYFL